MSPEAYAVAVQSLSTLAKLTTPENAVAMGFQSPDEATHAAVAQALRVYLVRLDELREYSADVDPSALLHPLDKIIALIAVGGEVKSSIEVEKTGERWIATSFGAPNHAKLLSQALKASVRAGAASPEACFVVHVAGLNRFYTGYRSDRKLLLTPVLDDPATGFLAGRQEPATEALAKLATTARSYNGLPH